ncbi:MAG: sn-glycerol-3-phosphate ABC transporter ATP-binding protein UgpC, partial [Allorhizobium sp.]
MASIDITEVSKIYDKGGAKAVDSVDIQIEDGEFIVLVGP